MSKGVSTKKVLSWLHRWPGIISAIIVFFVCITGTIAVYCDEIMDLSAGDARYVVEVKDQKLPVDSLINRIKEELPSRKAISYMVAYKDPQRSVRFNTYSQEDGLKMIYMDPYTGEILKDDGTIFFFYTLVHLHNSLLLGKTGQWIVDIATLIFVLELLTGLYLWWPKRWNKSARKGAFKVRVNSTGKRLNYDLHKVLGFYSLGVVLLLSLTGLIIAFQPLSNAVMKSFGADTTPIWKLPSAPIQEGRASYDVNLLIQDSFKQYPSKSEARLMTYNLDKTGSYTLCLAERVSLKSAQSPQFITADRYTGELLQFKEGTEKQLKVDNAIWVLHMGNWMGQFGKFITFLGGLIASSLPITGFYIWWGRRKKKPKA